ncbi:M23 family metallopeptidase [Bacillus shivajii]|uniref:M23 family metallopeptidase n=1 Tax=Bacillus shivajii TaxID=1983719 RepID=UPI001CFA66D5|nr:M23 family metallopeptidase [Bacillus shivajii]UCZ52084.1 M23 family metallopeptidase [Bacillus shivajii]
MDMKNRVERLKRKMDAKRKKRVYSSHQDRVKHKARSNDYMYYGVRHDEEREETLFPYEARRPIAQEKSQPFFRKDMFMMQVLASVCLFFIIGILFQTQAPALAGVKNFVHQSFQEDFQFGAVANWYEDAFGRPLALFPPQLDTVAPADLDNEQPLDSYALPASGTIKESFQQNGRGIYVETTSNEPVEAVRSGVVRFVGEDEENEWGKMVVLRHYDGTESWYGMLDNVSVQLYDHVDSGDKLGMVSPHQEKEAVGVYYFALRDNDIFVDPIDVISVD